MIANVLLEINKEFQDNWTGPITFGDNEYTPTGETWIRVDVQPLFIKNASYSGALDETHALYVTSYHRNQTQASLLADAVTNFIQNRIINGLQVLNFEPVSQRPVVSDTGQLTGGYQLRTMYKVKTICTP